MCGKYCRSSTCDHESRELKVKQKKVVHSKAVSMPDIIADSLMPAIYSIMYISIRGGGGSQFLNLRIRTYLHNHGKDNRRNKRRWHIFKQKPTWISCVNQSKINTTQLSSRNNAFTQPRRPFRDLHAPWVLFTAGKLLIGYNLSVFWDSVRHCGQRHFS